MRALLIAMAVILGGGMGSTQAHAIGSGYTLAGTNLRAGPGYEYRRLDFIPAGVTVAVYVCTWNGHWCDIGWRYRRGWIDTRYLNRYPYARHYGLPNYYQPPYWSFDFRYYDRDRYPERPYRYPQRDRDRRH